MDSTTPDVRVIGLSEIRENPVALRAVNRDSEAYIGLRDSIAEVGILNSISVRERTEHVDGNDITFYELVDGLHRYVAATEVGLTRIAVQIKDLDDIRTLEAQIMANIHKIETKPVEFTRQLQRIFAANPLLTLADMAAKVSKSPSWVGQRLNLLKLEPTLQKAVDEGKITVSNAVQLAKLPPAEQVNYVDQATTMDATEFVPLVQSRVKELKEAAKQGRAAQSSEFVPLPRLQKMSTLKAELENPTIGKILCKKYGTKTGFEGFALGIAWVLNLDPTSIEVRKAEADAKKVALEEAKKKRKAERAAAKAEDAAKLAAEAAEAVTVG